MGRRLKVNRVLIDNDNGGAIVLARSAHQRGDRADGEAVAELMLAALPYKCTAWCLCKSSMVVAFGVRGSSLFVQYKDGSVYRYPGLANHFTALYNAASVGGYVHRNIKHATFKKVKSGKRKGDARQKQTKETGEA